MTSNPAMVCMWCTAVQQAETVFPSKTDLVLGVISKNTEGPTCMKDGKGKGEAVQ